MAGETTRERHARLQERTAELKREHENLSLYRTPFSQADHDEHTAHLRQHVADLKCHRAQLTRTEG